jgi:hypothetical protein
MIIFWHFVTKYAVSDCQWTVVLLLLAEGDRQ